MTSSSEEQRWNSELSKNFESALTFDRIPLRSTQCSLMARELILVVYNLSRTANEQPKLAHLKCEASY